MTWIEWIAIIASILTLLSFFINIIQSDRRRSELKSLRTHAQGTYNSYYLVARACTRARQTKGETIEQQLKSISGEIELIRGISDTARSNIVAYSREHLNFTPFYEHPAYPGIEQSNEVKLGTPPEEKNRNIKVVK